MTREKIIKYLLSEKHIYQYFKHIDKCYFVLENNYYEYIILFLNNEKFSLCHHPKYRYMPDIITCGCSDDRYANVDDIIKNWLNYSNEKRNYDYYLIDNISDDISKYLNLL